MGTQLKLILATVCIENFLLASVRPHSQTDGTHASGIQFLNFNSIVRKGANKNEIYSEILKREAARERQIFSVLKDELRIARNRNAYKEIKKNENVVEFKREVDGNKRVRISLDDVFSISTTRKYNIESMNKTFNDTSWEDVEKYPKENFDIIYTRILGELSLNETSKQTILTTTDESIDRTSEALMSCVKKAYNIFVGNCFFAYVVGGVQKFRKLFLKACTVDWLDPEKISEAVNHVCEDYRIGFLNRNGTGAYG